MARTGYHYNAETLSFDRVDVTTREKIGRGLWKFFSSFSLAIVFFIISWNFIPSPREKTLKRENEEILSRYDLLGGEVGRLYETLSDLEQRDDNIYRVIFEADPIAPPVRRAGTGGTDRYANLKHLENASLVIETTRRIDMLARAIYIQSKSYDEVETLARNKAEMLASIPAILPVALNGVSVRVTSAFGPRLHPLYNVVKPHSGMDFSGTVGVTPIHATGNGVIERCDMGSGTGATSSSTTASITKPSTPTSTRLTSQKDKR
jgi:murein DD-endopeptidase MepM/ murein hydrolase activator NlpD